INERKNKYLHDREETIVTFKVDEDYYDVIFNKYDKNKDYDQYVESLIKSMSNLKQGELYNMRCYNFIPEDGERKVVGVTFKHNDNKVEQLRQRFAKKDGTVTEGDVPELIFKKKKGGWVCDKDDQQEYLYEVYKKNLERLF